MPTAMTANIQAVPPDFFFAVLHRHGDANGDLGGGGTLASVATGIDRNASPQRGQNDANRKTALRHRGHGRCIGALG